MFNWKLIFWATLLGGSLLYGIINAASADHSITKNDLLVVNYLCNDTEETKELYKIVLERPPENSKMNDKALSLFESQCSMVQTQPAVVTDVLLEGIDLVGAPVFLVKVQSASGPVGLSIRSPKTILQHASEASG